MKDVLSLGPSIIKRELDQGMPLLFEGCLNYKHCLSVSLRYINQTVFKKVPYSQSPLFDFIQQYDSSIVLIIRSNQ